jgi:hypothetical protein
MNAIRCCCFLGRARELNTFVPANAESAAKTVTEIVRGRLKMRVPVSGGGRR